MLSKCKSSCGRFAVFAVIGIAVAGLVVMSLWNWLTPELFGWKPISYLQALGVLVLSKILFGSFRGHGHPGYIHDRKSARLERMTPEERERFRSDMRSKWCGCSSSDTHENAAGQAGADH